MQIHFIKTLNGPNVYHHKPVLLMRLGLDEMEGKESCEYPDFLPRLLEALPGLREHHCSRGYPGGFVERLYEGTYFGHVIEHVAIELSQLAGIGVTYGKTVYAGEPGVYNVAVRFTAEQGMQHLLAAAVDFVESLLKGEPYDIAAPIEEAKRLAARHALGPSTGAIVEAASRRGIPWMRVDDDSLVQLGYGKHRKLVEAALSSNTSQIAVDLAGNKEATKKMLEAALLPVPHGRVVQNEAEAEGALEELGGCVVVKPLDGNQGRGVSTGLRSAEQVRHAFHVAAEYCAQVLVEQQLEGLDYRVLVVGGRMVAASERMPCHVIGDGTHSMAELIAIANEDPHRGLGHEKPLTRITIDDVVQAFLRKHGRSLDDVPEPGERVFLRGSANLSKGGIARDVTDAVHPEVVRVCERAARVVGLDICGVDLITEDIGRPLEPGKGGIVELNAAPGLRMHRYPSEGAPRDVGGAIVDMLYPPGTTARIPLISITGTNGKTTVTRIIGHAIAQATDCCVGMTTTDGIYIGGQCVATGDLTGPASAHVVLSDPAVEVAVLETARGGIVRRGLGYDWSDIGIMTNIGPDHIGQDGIEDVQDIVHIKSLVAERVREGGTLILNADDDELVRLAEEPSITKVPRKMVWFSQHPQNARVRRHVAAGGVAFFVRNGWIVEARGRREFRVVRVVDVPLTMGGVLGFQVANCLAAAAACRAFGLSRRGVAAALVSFEPNEHNSGRANLYRVGESYVFVDYGHNSDAFRAVCESAAAWRGRHKTTGIISVPGDRDDEIIREAGRVAATGFDRVIIREDEDLRGRARGVVADILCEAVRTTAPTVTCEVVLNEVEALRRELDAAGSGNVIVLFFEHLSNIEATLAAYGAEPIAFINGDTLIKEEIEPIGAGLHQALARNGHAASPAHE